LLETTRFHLVGVQQGVGVTANLDTLQESAFQAILDILLSVTVVIQKVVLTSPHFASATIVEGNLLLSSSPPTPLERMEDPMLLEASFMSPRVDAKGGTSTQCIVSCIPPFEEIHLPLLLTSEVSNW
jgi:hypothetical protein